MTKVKCISCQAEFDPETGTGKIEGTHEHTPPADPPAAPAVADPPEDPPADPPKESPKTLWDMWAEDGI